MNIMAPRHKAECKFVHGVPLSEMPAHLRSDLRPWPEEHNYSPFWIFALDRVDDAASKMEKFRRSVGDALFNVRRRNAVA
jgi:hypothetical protein